MFNLDLQIRLMEQYLYGEDSEKTIDKASPKFNKISVILNTIGFERLEKDYISLLKDEHSKDLEIIINVYRFNETIVPSILKQLWKIEILLTSRLSFYASDKKILWNKESFDKKIKLFLELDQENQLSIIKTINKKCKLDNYIKGIVYAKNIRNKISHIDWSVIGKIEIPKNDMKKLGNKKYFYLSDITNILDDVSGNEKYISDIYSRQKNIISFLK